MSSSSLRRSVAILAFAALLAPVSGLHAAQGRQQRVPATSAAPRHNPVIELVLRLLASAGALIDAGAPIDGNG